MGVNIVLFAPGQATDTCAAELVVDETELDVRTELVLEEIVATADEECPGPSRRKVQLVRLLSSVYVYIMKPAAKTHIFVVV